MGDQRDAQKHRRARVRKTRANAAETEQRRLDDIIGKLRQAKHGAALWDDEVETILQALDLAEPPMRGAPVVMAMFHRWFAIHGQHLRDGGATRHDANADVADAWGISSDAANKYFYEHRDAARQFLDACGDDHAGIEQNIHILVKVFKAIGQAQADPHC